jgi:hypothetical protein
VLAKAVGRPLPDVVTRAARPQIEDRDDQSQEVVATQAERFKRHAHGNHLKPLVQQTRGPLQHALTTITPQQNARYL